LQFIGLQIQDIVKKYIVKIHIPPATGTFAMHCKKKLPSLEQNQQKERYRALEGANKTREKTEKRKYEWEIKKT
jgi:hypothetical protein